MVNQNRMFRATALAPMFDDVIQRARSLHLLPGPWSLCELRLEDGDVEGLRQWARALTPEGVTLDDFPLTAACIPVPRGAAFGLVFSLFATEIGRREGMEGRIWTTMQDGRFRADTAGWLFGADGQPVPQLRRGIERAFWQFNLRHVFGVSGLQSWMDSIFLQFGFTRRGLRRLPWWLAGEGCSQAVERLLQGRLKSDAFDAMWRDLKAIRNGKAAASEVRPRLVRSPWLLPAWVDEAMAQAARRAPTPAEGRDPSFFSPPRLRWKDGPPVFTLGAAGVDLLDLVDDAYDVVCGGRVLTRLLRQADGRYEQLGELTLPLDPPEVVLSLVNRAGDELVSETIELWHPHEEVNVFRLRDGARLPDPFVDKLSPSLEHALLLSHDLEIVPEAPREWVAVDGGTRRLYRIPPPPEIQVLLGGELFWEPNRPAEEPAWAADVELTWMRAGDDVRLEVWHPDDVRVRSLRVNRQSPAFVARRDDATLTDVVHVHGDNFTRRLECHIGLAHGEETCRVVRVQSLDLVRMLARDERGTREITSDSHCSIEDLGEVRIFPPKVWAGTADADWVMMEGHVWVGRPSSRWGKLQALSGWGNPLTLRTRPYNSREPDLVLVEELTRHGIVAGVEHVDRRLRLSLRTPLTVSDAHRVVVWTEDGAIEELTPADDWSIPCAEKPVVVGVAYADAALGGWWRDDWSQHLDALCAADLDGAMWLLHWLRLPLLSARDLRNVARVARQHPVEFLDLWTEGDLDEAAASVPRTLLEPWRPSRDVAAALVKALSDERGPYQAAVRLLRVDPILMARVLTTAEVPLKEVCLALSGCPTLPAMEKEIDRLEKTTAESMGVSLEYVRKLARGLAEERISPGAADYRDARLALTVEPFRRLTGLRCLLMAYVKALVP